MAEQGDAPQPARTPSTSPIMAVDVGTVRIGLAKSDPSGRIALPIAPIAAKPREAALQTILTYARELRPSQVIVGLPLTLDGDEATASMRSRRFAAQLQKLIPCRVAMIDERLTTVVAEAALRDADVSRSKRKQVIDQAAATILLQTFLDHRAGR